MSDDEIKALWKSKGLQFGGEFGWKSVFEFAEALVEQERRVCIDLCRLVGGRYHAIQKAASDNEGVMMGLTGEIAANLCANSIAERNGLPHE
jgi:hypothetical protein